jgi:membrane protein involved in colicin uptake
MKADKNELESQTAEQRVAAYALRDRERDRKRAAKELAEEAQRVAKEVEDAAKRVAKAEHDRKRAAKELVEDEAKCGAKAECDCKRAEKVAEDEARRVAKPPGSITWTAEVDASIESMLDGGDSFSKIASKLGNGLTRTEIINRWHRELKKSSGIIKPAVQSGFTSRFTWTEDVDEMIVRMRTDGDSFPKIASELGNGLAGHDIKNRWNRHLKDKLQ